jgi:hypothetical protein
LKFGPLEQAIGENEETKTSSGPPPKARKLTELVLPADGDPNELLKHRFLCRGGGLLLCGPTGIGKSAFELQCAIQWARGRPCFGIEPTRPLKSLLIQAENDDGDLVEMRDGVVAGLRLSAEEAKLACDNIIVVREDSRTGGDFFFSVVRPLLAEHRPDILWIDPALTYLGGEAGSQKDVGIFLRNMLNPLLLEFNRGCVVVHHTNKPPAGNEKPRWQAGDFAYLGSGSIEWANWARGVLALRSVGSHSIFEMRVGKRGARLRWKEADGKTPAYARFIAHSKEAGVICWRDAEEGKIPRESSQKKVFTKEDLMPHVPTKKAIRKDELKSKCNSAGLAQNRFNGMITELVEEGKLFEWHRNRKGTNAEKLIARFAQPLEELIL